jgi:2-oxoisovalerate ferredoxin oxidoreductase beta subunit
MSRKIIHGKPGGFFDEYHRKPGNKTSTHYCPGCGHGILHKLIAEAVVDLGMKDNTVFICPVGCSVFGYYYFDLASISVPHGRAPAVATGIVRSNPDCCVISYQGDGDLGAIGFNEFIQAANRGENIAVFFVNNGVYGMTGGQLAPTTLPGQKTVTSPDGRSVETEGYPLKVCEMVAALDSPIYVERVAITSPKNIRTARQAMRKALTYMKEKKGFSLVEFLVGCPVNLKKNTRDTDEWIEKNMIPYFPVKCFKDIASERQPKISPVGIYGKAKVKEMLLATEKIHPFNESETPIPDLKGELRIKCAGFGGQGILSLGMLIAEAGHLQNLNASWLPSYGPEMRGGTANCSVVLNRDSIGSPIVKSSDVLIAMNQPSIDRFSADLSKNGIVIYDSVNIKFDNKNKCRTYPIDASLLAKDVIGDVRCANSVMLGAFFEIIKIIDERAFINSINNNFQGKGKVIELNLKAFNEGRKNARAMLSRA